MKTVRSPRRRELNYLLGKFGPIDRKIKELASQGLAPADPRIGPAISSIVERLNEELEELDDSRIVTVSGSCPGDSPFGGDD